MAARLNGLFVARPSPRRNPLEPVLQACTIVLALLMPAVACAEADYAREKRWADEIVPGILVGQPVTLELASGRRFLGIYAAAGKDPPGVVIVHGAGLHPDWGLNGVLRSALADAGYATLAVQMPVLGADARGEQYAPLLPESAERLGVAVDYLRRRGHVKVAIVAHSVGARMAQHFLDSTTGRPVDAWVAIGTTGMYSARPAAPPVLDLYGAHDFPAVRDNAAERAERLRRVRGSAQVEVPGADHFFTGHESALVRHVKLFLDQKLK